tara:strand:+ start:5169 stop:5633 length:465 start_codon:yes stop_codon:yes gene_type:complete
MKLMKYNLKDFFKNLNEYVNNLNNSKVFAGLMIIILNIASRFHTIKLSKTIESYLKYTFSKQILIFAIAWMGTRDIYIAFVIVLVFTLLMDFLLNEDSMFCCLPESFINDHKKKDEDDSVSDDDIQKAKAILEKAEKQKEGEQKNITMDGLYNY